MTDPPGKRPKRRWLRYSLRSLLLGMLVVSVVLGWKVERARKQRAAVRWVLENGGKVRYEYQKFDPTGYPLASPPPGPTWLRDTLGIDFLDRVTYVYLAGSQVSDLTPLSALTELRSLDLGATPVSDLAPLSRLSKLQKLNLSDCYQVSDLTPLARLTALQMLWVSSMPRVTDFGPIARLKQLQDLYAYNTPVSDLIPLAELTELRHVDLLDGRASDLSPLRNLKNLRTLRFRGGQVSDIDSVGRAD